MFIRIVHKRNYIYLIVLHGLLSCLAINSYGQTCINNRFDDIMPFEAIIANADYSMAYSIKTILTNKEVKIIFDGKVEGDKDSVIFSKSLPPSDTLRQISAISLIHLKSYYSNDCILDGSQVTVTLKRGKETKTVHLSNYYQEDVGKILYLVNSLIPDKYKVWYDKEKLIADYKLCNKN